MITDPKRKRCSIELCEGYCDDTTISVICDSCSAENRNLRFCPMHVPHVSHSGQLGFIDQPLAVPPVTLLQAVVDSNSSNTTVPQQDRVVSRVVVSASGQTEKTSSTAILLQSRTERESSSCRECSTIPLSDPQLQVVAEVETSCSSSSSSGTSELNSVEKKVLRLFEEGFQQSLKTNISPQLKVLGALNHSCYKEHLGIIVSHFKLSVAIPSVSSLSKTTGREQYLNEVVKAYDGIRKGKNGV